MCYTILSEESSWEFAESGLFLLKREVVRGEGVCIFGGEGTGLLRSRRNGEASQRRIFIK